MTKNGDTDYYQGLDWLAAGAEADGELVAGANGELADRPESGEKLPSLRGAALEAARVHIDRAEGIWHRPGQGEAALAHRLAAAVILALIVADSRYWRLSPLVRDIVTLGNQAVPPSIEALCRALEEASEGPFLSMVLGLAGDMAVAERRFREVVGLVSTAAREIAAPP